MAGEANPMSPDPSAETTHADLRAEPVLVEPAAGRVPAQSMSVLSWRERLLNSLLTAAAVLGLPAIVAGSIAALRAGQPNRVVVFAVAYSFVLLLAFGRRIIPYNLRALLLLIVALGIGLDSLLASGLPGSGRVFLLAFLVFASLLFGSRSGWLALVLSLVGVAAVGTALSSGVLPVPSQLVASSADPLGWLAGGAAFALLGFILIRSLAMLLQGLELSVKREGETARQLDVQRNELEANVSLRTAELERQSRQLQAAAEIAKLSAEARGSEGLLSEAVELIRDRFDFYHVSIFLLDNTSAWAELAASSGTAGRSLLARRHKLAVGSASIVGWVTANRMPRVSPDVATDPFYFKNPSLPDTRSEMAVPLMIGQRLIGALDVQSSRTSAFGESDIRLVEAIASDLAFAIDHARLSQEQKTRLYEMEGEVQERTRQSWTRFSRTGTPSVIHLGAAGEPEGNPAPFTGLDKASRTGQTSLSEDRREVVVPVRVRGEAIATIGARKPETDEAWSQEDIVLIEAVAGQAALAMETARQYAEEQRRVAELEAVNRVSQAASQLLRVDSLLRMVGRQIVQVMGETDVQVALYDAAHGRITFPYATDQLEPVDLPELNIGQGLVSHVIRSQQPLVIADSLQRQAAELGVEVDDPAIKSWLGVPLLAGNQTIGVLVAQDKNREWRFSEDDVALLSTVAGQVATALQNARLLEQVQQAARRERLIHEITSKVRRSPDIQTVLETTAREVGRALNAARATIRLGEAPLEHLPPGAQPPIEVVEE